MWRSSFLAPRNVLRTVASVAGVCVAVTFVMVPFSPAAAAVMVGALTVIAIILVLLGRARRGERAAAQRFASLSDWTFLEQMSGLFSRLTTPPFDALEASYTNVVAGRFGGYECFDGTYEWRKRIDKDTYVSGRHRVAAVRLPDELPRLLLVPEGLTSRLAKAFGGIDMDLESSEFNKRWRVLADDPKVASAMLNPRVIASLEAMEHRAPLLFERGLGVRIDDESTGVDSLAQRLGGIVAVARFVPQHTIDDFGRLANSVGPLPSVATPGALTHGYDAARIARDEEYLRTAMPRKRQKWIDAARGKTLAGGEAAADAQHMAPRPDDR